MRRKALSLITFACVMLCMSVGTARAADPPVKLYEQKIKAGLVYNLLKYTEWPEPSLGSSAEEPKKNKSANRTAINVCIFGDDPFDGYLTPLQGRTANQAVISIVHILEVNQVHKCQALIIHRSEEKNLASLLESLNDKSVLTISDIANFSEQGGMIELAKEGEKIALFVNNKTVSQAGLVIQDPMLKLAKVVGS